jgi:uncharacterized membrane protein
MNKMLLAVFANHVDAEAAINDLEKKGFRAQDISVIMNDSTQAKVIAKNTAATVAGDTAGGAVTGGIVGGLAGLLMGLTAITLPGLGAFFIAGPLATALGLTGAAASAAAGTMTGAAAGGLLGALLGLGFSEDEAKVYQEYVGTGKILITVPVTTMQANDVERILDDNNAVESRLVNQPNNQI